MNELPPVIIADRPRSKRSWPLQFSLWTLCLVVAAACVAAAWYGMRQRERAAIADAQRLRAQVSRQQEEISSLRAELGYLTISDKSKVHVLKLESPNDYHWQWRIYLPPGRKWQLCSGLGKVPLRGRKNFPHGWSSVDDGEFTLQVYFDRDEDGLRRFNVRRGNGGKTSYTFPEEEFQQLKKAGYSTSTTGTSQTEVRDPGAPIELIRLRQYRQIPGPPGSQSFASSDEPEFGILVWIE